MISGATYPPERSYVVRMIEAHQPEFDNYVDRINGEINPADILVLAWDGTGWGFGQALPDIGDSLYINIGYVELKLPEGSIGMEQKTRSASIMLFSVNRDTNLVDDLVSSDPNVRGSALLGRFSSVSEHMNLIFPPSTITGDPHTIPSMLPY